MYDLLFAIIDYVFWDVEAKTKYETNLHLPS